MTIEYKHFSGGILQLKRATLTETGTFTAYASTWDGEPDLQGDIVQKYAFSSAIAKHQKAGTLPAMLWSHNQSEPVGRWTDIREDDHGLLVTGKLSLGTKRGREAYELLKDGALSFSIGFVLAANGAERKGNIRVLKRIERLHEISLVAIPANPNAKLVEVKKPETPKEFERLLRDVAGFSVRDSKKLVSGGWKSLVCDERATLDDVLAEVQALKLELQTRYNHEHRTENN